MNGKTDRRYFIRAGGAAAAAAMFAGTSAVADR
jgi:hypothetical protein